MIIEDVAVRYEEPLAQDLVRLPFKAFLALIPYLL